MADSFVVRADVWSNSGVCGVCGKKYFFVSHGRPKLEDVCVLCMGKKDE